MRAVMSGDVDVVLILRFINVCVPTIPSYIILCDIHYYHAVECRPTVNVTTPELSIVCAYKYYITAAIDGRAGTAVAGIEVRSHIFTLIYNIIL